ncbi:MAG: zinc ribbon domain-containing protein [Lachnospiraceae bacterium]|nr:zinc ribbon domain-containing protein [Lachnospiraceae bacterium]
MFCNNCGIQLPEDADFCPECGTKTEQAAEEKPVREAAQKPEQKAEQQPEQQVTSQQPAGNPVPEAKSGKKPKKDKKGLPFKILIPVTIVFILAVAFLVFIFTRKGDSGKIAMLSEDVVIYNYSGCFANLSGESYEEEDIWSDSVSYNGDNSIISYLVEEGDSYSLYYIKADMEPKLVAEDVDLAAISYTGEYIVYMQDVEDYTAGDLYLYCVKNGKITKIDTDVYPEYICMSPSGKAVAYIRDYEDDEDNSLYIGGAGIKNKEVDNDGCVPVALTDNGKTLYYIYDTDRLYIYRNNDSKKLASDVNASSFWFNKDLSEFLFIKNDKTYYYANKMEEPVQVSNSMIYDIVTPKSSNILYRSGMSSIVATDTLKGCVLSIENGMYWFNNEGTDTVRIYSYPDSYVLSDDCTSAVYVMGGDLYKINRFDEKMEAEVLYDEENVDYVIASDDLSRIYIVVENELYYLKGKNKVEKITHHLDEEMDEAYTLAYNNEMKKIFFIEDDTLYYAGTGSKSGKMVQEGVTEVYECLDGIIYYAIEDDETCIYYMEGKTPVKIFTY